MFRTTMRAKRYFESVIRSFGLYNSTIRILQRSLRFHPLTLTRNYQHRQRGAPDGLPIPPGELMYMVVGHYDVQRFLNTTTPLMIRKLLARNGFKVSNFGTILDFGCGCGRLMRHWSGLENIEFYGCDINPQLVHWCQQNLLFAKFYVNELSPPLCYTDEKFDFVYAFSVFTHLPEELQKAWMRELARIIAPGGLVIITTHGEYYFDRLQREEQKVFFNGDLVVKYPQHTGANFCNAFHSFKYVKHNLAEGFDVVDFLPGGGASRKEQDIYLLQKT